MAGGRDNPGRLAARRDAMDDDTPAGNGHSGGLIVVERPSAAITAAAHQARRNGRNAVARRPNWRTTGQNSLVGSAARINLGDRRAVRRSRAHRQGWQTEAWDYWDEVGEVRYVTSYMANLISKLKLYPAVDSLDGPVSVESDTSGDEHQAAAIALQDAGVTPAVAAIAVETLARLRSVQGGQSAMLRELALNLEVAGECFLHGHAEPVDSAEPGNPAADRPPIDLAAPGEPPDNTANPATIEDWNVRSIDELVSTGDQFELRLGPGSKTGDPIPDTDLIIRIWERHPRYSEQASCAMRSVLPECEALLLLSREIRATAKSRLSNGILLIPSELSFGSIDPTADPGDGEEEEDPFDAELQESMITPIMEEGSASAVVPLVLRGPAELLQHVNHLAIDKALDPVLDARIEQRILRIGRGLNMPTEAATGFMATTFANASAIKRSEYEDHAEPRATLIVDAITNGYFQWALEEAGVDGEIARNIFVWFDPSALLIVEDMSEQAVEAHKDGVISDAARRKYQGFKEEDAPDADELARRVVLHGGRIDPTIFGYLVKQALGDENLPIPAPPAGILGVAESVSAAPVPGAPPETDVTVGGAPLEPIAEPPPVPVLPPGTLPPAAEPAPGAPPPETKPAEPVAAAATPRNRDAEWKKLGRTLAGMDRELRTRITAKLDQAMSTALDKAGARIRTRIQRDKGGEKSILAKSVETTPRRQIASQLGKQVVDQTGLSDEQLVHGEFETALDDINLWMGLTYDRAMRAVERVAGPPTAARRQERDARHTRDRARAISWLRDNLHQLAGARLYSPTPTRPPTGEHDGTVLIPASLVRAAVAVAGGATPRGGTGDTTVAVASAWVDIGGAGPVTDENGDPLGGIGTGPNVMGAADDGGGQTEGYQWEYGEGLRSEFIPHVDLDGITVSEPDQFEWGPNYEGFPEVDVPFPGDHEGCVCNLTPVLIGPDESTRTETPEDLLAQDEAAAAQSEAAPEDTAPAATADGYTTQEAPGWSTLNPSQFADWLGYTPGSADISEADLKAAADLLPEVRQQVKDAAAAVAEEHRAIFESAGYGDKGSLKYIYERSVRIKQGDTGTGLYDWFDSLKTAEKNRVRDWMEPRGTVSSARSGIDEVSEGLAPYFGMPADTDSTIVMERWLQETRIIDAAQAVANGRMINPDRYGGLDINSLIESRYDLRTLFLRKEAAAEDVAHVIAGQSVDQARDLLGYGTFGPELGPAPWEMSQVEYVEEATRLEDVLAGSYPTGTDEWGDPIYSPEANRALDRMRELVPPGLDNPDSQLSFNELYREVIQVARTGGLV